MAKMSVMAREECNGHTRCNKRADKEYTWKATKAVHFRGFCVSLITHTPHAHHCSGTPHALLAGVVHSFRKPILQMSVRSTPCCFSVRCPGPFKKPSPPALCSRQLRLMDVALGLGFKAGDVCSLSRSSGMCEAHVTRLGDWGRTRRPAGCWVCMLSLWSSLK